MSNQQEDTKAQVIPTSVQNSFTKEVSENFSKEVKESYSKEEEEKHKKVLEDFEKESPTPTISKKDFFDDQIKPYEFKKGLDEVTLKMLDSKIKEKSIPIIYRDENNMYLTIF